MFDTIAPRYDLVNRLMTFGLDRTWRRRAVGELDLAPSSLVLDLGCGTGDLLATLGRDGYRCVGADLSFQMLACAPEGRGPLLQADGARLPLPGAALDGLVSGFALRNLTDLPGMLAEAARVLRPAGRLSLLEVDTPDRRLLALGHGLWFKHVVPRIGAALSDADAYAYLPRSVAYLPPPAELAGLIEAAGFEEVRRHRLSGGIVQVLTATRSRPEPGRPEPDGEGVSGG